MQERETKGANAVKSENLVPDRVSFALKQENRDVDSGSRKRVKQIIDS